MEVYSLSQAFLHSFPKRFLQATPVYQIMYEVTQKKNVHHFNFNSFEQLIIFFISLISLNIFSNSLPNPSFLTPWISGEKTLIVEVFNIEIYLITSTATQFSLDDMFLADIN